MFAFAEYRNRIDQDVSAELTTKYPNNKYHRKYAMEVEEKRRTLLQTRNHRN